MRAAPAAGANVLRVPERHGRAPAAPAAGEPSCHAARTAADGVPAEGGSACRFQTQSAFVWVGGAAAWPALETWSLAALGDKPASAEPLLHPSLRDVSVALAIPRKYRLASFVRLMVNNRTHARQARALGYSRVV